MKTPALVPIVVLALAVLALSACGDAEEITPTASRTVAGTSPETPSPVATATAQPGATVPADWATFRSPDEFGAGTFRYPPNWHREPGGIYSSDPARWPSVCIPPEGVKIQPSALPVEEVPRPKGATDFTLGPYSGWELFEEALEDCPGRAHTVAIERGGLLYTVGFYSGLAVQDEDVFQQILASLTFDDGA